MLPPKKDPRQQSLFFGLRDTLDQKHPLYILAHQIDWDMFEKNFAPLYCPHNGRPAKPIRLMVGLLILKHLRNLSDESLVEQWRENVYYQYFCGENTFVAGPPCEPSELVHFRKRIGEQGIELILKESIRINGKDAQQDTVSIDTTVQEKNITFPTDGKLHRKIIVKCWKIARQNHVVLHRSYKRTLKKLALVQRLRHHPRHAAQAKKADKKVKVIAGRLVRELERKLPDNQAVKKQLDLFKQILSQHRKSQNKIYSIHEEQVCCISKGKVHKKYEFGNKVSIVKTHSGVIVGAKAFRNEYDGHTLEQALGQVATLTGQSPRQAVVDRGYRGKCWVGSTRILVPDKPKKQLSRYEQEKLRKAHRKRAGIEAVIAHLKADHRLSRNFYKGVFGDNINVMLAAAAFNFKRMMNKWKQAWEYFWRMLLHLLYLICRRDYWVYAGF